MAHFPAPTHAVHHGYRHTDPVLTEHHRWPLPIRRKSNPLQSGLSVVPPIANIPNAPLSQFEQDIRVRPAPHIPMLVQLALPQPRNTFPCPLGSASQPQHPEAMLALRLPSDPGLPVALPAPSSGLQVEKTNRCLTPEPPQRIGDAHVNSLRLAMPFVHRLVTPQLGSQTMREKIKPWRAGVVKLEQAPSRRVSVDHPLRPGMAALSPKKLLREDGANAWSSGRPPEFARESPRRVSKSLWSGQKTHQAGAKEGACQSESPPEPPVCGYNVNKQSKRRPGRGTALRLTTHARMSMVLPGLKFDRQKSFTSKLDAEGASQAISEESLRNSFVLKSSPQGLATRKQEDSAESNGDWSANGLVNDSLGPDHLAFNPCECETRDSRRGDSSPFGGWSSSALSSDEDVSRGCSRATDCTLSDSRQNTPFVDVGAWQIKGE